MSILSKIQALMASANTVTGSTATDLTAAMQALVDGYGGGTDWIQYATYLDSTFRNATGLPSVVVINAPNCISINAAFRECTGPTSITLNTAALTNMGFAFFYGVTAQAITTITIPASLAGVANYQSAFYKMQYLETINATLDFSAITSFGYVSSMFFQNYALVDVSFAPSTLSVNIGLSYSSNLSAASLISLANCLVAGLTQTVSLHATAKTTCDNTYVINDNGTAVLSDSSASGAMTLTSFITTVKGWTIA